MNIIKYAGYFHDGTIHEINHTNQSIKIGMESAQLLPEWNEDNLQLSKSDTISGYLHINNIEKIEIDKKTFNGLLKRINDSGEIVSLRVKLDKINLIVRWIKFSTDRPEDDPVADIEIYSKEIYWENCPSSFDAYWED